MHLKYVKGIQDILYDWELLKIHGGFLYGWSHTDIYSDLHYISHLDLVVL